MMGNTYDLEEFALNKKSPAAGKRMGLQIETELDGPPAYSNASYSPHESNKDA